MILTYGDIVSHYSKKKYPCVNQAELIANKYKQLFGRDIETSQEIYLLNNVASLYRPADRNSKIEDTGEAGIEQQAFDIRFKQLKRLKKFLKDLGIEKKSYLFIYDYENMVVSQNQTKNKELLVNFQFPRIYVVLFEKEPYNFIRLIYEYEEEKDPIDYLDLIYDFSLDIDLENGNY